MNRALSSTSLVILSEAKDLCNSPAVPDSPPSVTAFVVSVPTPPADPSASHNPEPRPELRTHKDRYAPQASPRQNCHAAEASQSSIPKSSIPKDCRSPSVP